MYETMNQTIVDTELQEEMAKLSQEIASSDSLKIQLDNDFQRLTDERMRLSNELESLRGTIDKEEYILSKIDDDLLQLQQKVQEEYGITYSAAMQYKDENFDKEAGKERISECKQALLKLGSVNVNAIQELEETQSRYDDLLAQIDDLKRRKTTLKAR